MSKGFLIVVAILIIVMGILGLTVEIAGVKDPAWHAIAKIVVGLVALWVGIADKPKA